MRLRRRRSRLARRINPEGIRLQIVALVDVVLLLLLYFIMAGSIDDQESRLAATLAARGAGATTAMLPQQLLVGWSAGRPRWQMGERTITDRAALRSFLAGLPREPGLVVIPDPDAPIEAAATAIQLARDLGFTRISYASGAR
ncbi:MAG: biopolymer transporter ExbD [Phycisphaerales bacterium]|nr:biopolymer transporter ExbD [Phycisphaerales bacterium]